MQRGWPLLLAALTFACGESGGNPFAASSPSRPPGANAAILYVSGSWSSQPDAPRELMAISLDGAEREQLTTCARASRPCDVLQVAPSPDRSRVVAVRTTPDAEPGNQVLYFMDLSRSVETILLPRRRVESVDWSRDGSFLLFASVNGTAGNEDLFTVNPDGTAEQNLTESLEVRERRARLDPSARTAAFERIDAEGVSRIYLFRETPLTRGPASGPALPGTPYMVGADADPTFSPDAQSVVFRRLTGVGNGGLGTWDLLITPSSTSSTTPVRTLASGPLYRGAPDWSSRGIVFVETDAQAQRSDLVLIQADGSGRKVLRSESSTFRMGAPRWLP
jgi:Tol biopolymer transport system component